ncbi:MAG TPA: membrane protein insertase YidC [Pseudomonas sp.]|jgi:YidC/Oxa1 family membrane protein insertase|uniref:membrane protein insertase YidC n=1 Tax=Stutzerimonas TaxID=2901164 RepID=UPI000C665F0D|nr:MULTISPECIES: membrane protein insertase YidC [Stutzerimonas]MAL93189.1 membrane protein insertase YidC [Pseudomonas sp.]NCT78436.1 membrane protein insertase YidC [Stutzerimonas stutzeri]TDL96840.1 membrane protein insertase YidC [Stutzerimonas stutzeri ATCC 17588 = LMG 11199]MBA4727444.1 membrane protein insertase YidC [Pseudomonas sp.]MBK3919032.1 membrane protein insertase YidC [Stutzerimonas frequens]|tara:strand:- start:10636 stop:12306 length:1671 start_codon:yes stop_codon:yes gene_type:complete
MDIKRSILLVALAVVAYLMVLQWNQDYGQAALPTETAQSQPAAPALPDSPSATTEGNADDVPAVAGQQQASALPASAPSSQLIRVRTDVLDLAIDPRGGDIVELHLPQYPRRQDRPDVPFQLFERSGERTYEAQSGLIGDGPDKASGRPQYSSEKTEYRLAEGQDELVVDLNYSADGVNYTKRFTLERGNYALKVNYLIDNQSEKPWTGYLFGQLKRDNSGDPSSSTATGTATYLGAALWTKDEPYRKVSMGDMDESNLRESVQGGWIAWLQHYFVTAWIPQADDTNQVQTRKDSQGNYIIGFTGPAVTVPAGAQGETGATLYAGPKSQDKLEELSPGLRLTVDYGILWFIAQPIFWLLENIHALLGNWGWSIIVLTIVIKLAFFPLSAASYRSMARMRAVSPKMQALKEQHGDDRQKMSQAMMELYKKEKINPLGGCLPILVQMPVFLALYWVLLESVEMRQAPWMFWITDLSIKDPFFILPIIMGVTMFIQQQLNPTPPDPMQARVMKLLPIIFTFFFLWFPAGLVLYWVVNNVLSIAQQWYITRKIEAAAKPA